MIQFGHVVLQVANAESNLWQSKMRSRHQIQSLAVFSLLKKHVITLDFFAVPQKT